MKLSTEVVGLIEREQITAYCRQRKCTPNQFLHAAIKTELRELMGNAPHNEIKGDGNRVTQNVTNNTTVNLLSNITVEMLNNVRFFLFPLGGSWSDWARALAFYVLGAASVLMIAGASF